MSNIIRDGYEAYPLAGSDEASKVTRTTEKQPLPPHKVDVKNMADTLKPRKTVGESPSGKTNK